MERMFSLSEKGAELAEDSAIGAALDKVHSHDNEFHPFVKEMLEDDHGIDRMEPEEKIEAVQKEVRHSILYDALTEEEIRKLHGYFTRLGHEVVDAAWRIEGEPSNEGKLFTTPVIIRTIPASYRDLSILAGHGALDVLETGLVKIEAYADYGFESALKFGQFLAAASADRYDKGRWKRDEVNYNHQIATGVNKVVAMPMDIHGDFRLSVSEYYPDGSIDPLHAHQEFAPSRIGEKVLPAYHSVEPIMLQNLMQWAATIGMTEEEQAKVFMTAAREALGNTNYRGGFTAEHFDGGFDRMSASPISWLVDDDSEFDATKPRHLINGSLTMFAAQRHTIESYIMPDHSLALRIEPGADETDQFELMFDQEELPKLAKLLLEQTRTGLGRTSFEQMAGLIAYRYDSQFRDFVESENFYAHRKDRDISKRILESITKGG